MMKEKKLLYIMAIMFFIIFSTLTVLFIESRITKQVMSFHWENEQIITRLFQAYINKKDLYELIDTDYPTVNSLGFYNYYGDPIFTYGSARKKFNNVTRTVNIDKNMSTVMIERDFLSPFDPFKRTFSHEINIKKFTPENEWTANDKENFIRFVTLDVYDNTINYFEIRFRIIQVLTVLLILILIIFLVNIYKKNMNYREHIESTKRLVVLGTAARTLSHEIKNPLSIIRLQSSIIKRSGCTLHDNSLKIVNDEVSRITELTERVTDFLRHPKGYPERLDINKTLQTSLDKKGEISLQLPTEECLIYMDENRFISVIDNLINNAIESGSPKNDILISVKIINNAIQMIISDKGKGINSENISNLIDPFFTTKSKGSGLGLSIVSSYISAVDGQIKIKSAFGHGTDIIITIPRYKMIKDVQQ